MPVPTTMCISTMAGPHMVVGRPPRNGALPSRGRSFPQGSEVPRGGKGGRKEREGIGQTPPVQHHCHEKNEKKRTENCPTLLGGANGGKSAFCETRWIPGVELRRATFFKARQLIRLLSRPRRASKHRGPYKLGLPHGIRSDSGCFAVKTTNSGRGKPVIFPKEAEI